MTVFVDFGNVALDYVEMTGPVSTDAILASVFTAPGFMRPTHARRLRRAGRRWRARGYRFQD
jgi:hypothetical protein